MNTPSDPLLPSLPPLPGDWRWPNNDGIDPDSSRNITISHTFIDTGDDNICPKSSKGKGELSNLLVVDCQLRSRSSAIKFGSATEVSLYLRI